jgi:hypothetical protein
MKKISIILLITILSVSISIPFESVSTASGTDSLLETLQIPSDGSKVSSTIALQNGASYKIIVSGIYSTASPVQSNQQDAMYASHDNWATHLTGQSGLYIDRWTLGSKQWGNYDPDHIYQYTLTGNGSKINFYINDPSYNDNAGSLTVQILGTPVAPQSTPTPTSTASSAPTSSTSPTQSATSTPIGSPTTQPTNSPSSTQNSSPSQTATLSPTQSSDPLSGSTVTFVLAAIVTIIVVAALIFVLLRKQKNQN